MDWIDPAQDKDQWRDSCEHGNEPSGSIKVWEVLEQLHNWRLLVRNVGYSLLDCRYHIIDVSYLRSHRCELRSRISNVLLQMESLRNHFQVLLKEMSLSGLPNSCKSVSIATLDYCPVECDTV
jgi:hypothetical protein